MEPLERELYPNKMIVIERDKFTLTLWKRKPDEIMGERQLEFPVAIGMRYYRTPKFMSMVDVMDDSPEWKMPDSQWVRDLGLEPGTILQDDDPNNPIKARWIGISSTGIGIHGTTSDVSIGTKASHGCIRMHVPDVIELYAHVPLGIPVYVD